MTAVLQHLAYELERQRENEVHEREKLALRLENILLRERGLPPGNQRIEQNVEELPKRLEALEQENAALRQQLEQLTKE